MQQWIERSRTDAIAMAPQLLHHRQAEDGFLHGVQKHMDSNETGKEIARMIRHRIHYTAISRNLRRATACLLSKFDI